MQYGSSYGNISKKKNISYTRHIWWDNYNKNQRGDSLSQQLLQNLLNTTYTTNNANVLSIYCFCIPQFSDIWQDLGMKTH